MTTIGDMFFSSHFFHYFSSFFLSYFLSFFLTYLFHSFFFQTPNMKEPQLRNQHESLFFHYFFPFSLLSCFYFHNLRDLNSSNILYKWSLGVEPSPLTLDEEFESRRKGPTTLRAIGLRSTPN